jgi:STE24 endopeptidase
MRDVPAADTGAARRYARRRYQLLLADLFWSAGLLAVYQVSGVSAAVARWWSARTAAEPLSLLGYLLVSGGLYLAATLPLRYYGGFVLEHRFGLSRLTLRGWAVREAKHLAVAGGLGLLLLEGLYALLRAAPSAWPAWAAAGWVAVSIVLARVFPTLILPIFYKTAPVSDPALTDRLLALCRSAGLPTLGVHRFNLGAETRKANAALAGLGRSRRVLLSDTLVAEFPAEEIAGVLAHEVAHHRYHHLLIALGVGAVGSWVAFQLTAWAGGWWVSALDLEGLHDPAGVPVLLLWLSLLGFLTLPLQNGLSRWCEWQADRFAWRTTPPSVFANALRRLAALNLADPSPPGWVVAWFYDHPPITARILAADRAGK